MRGSRILKLCVLGSFLVYLLHKVLRQGSDLLYSPTQSFKVCDHNYPTTNILSTFDFVAAKEAPFKDRIFFLEMNPKRKQFTLFNLCSFESAARFNPGKTITILVSDDRSNPFPVPQFLMDLPNVNFQYISFRNLIAQSSLAEHWSDVKGTHFFEFSASDITRVVLMYHLGGAYMDNDVITTQKMTEKYSNFAPMVFAGKRWWINTCLLRFEETQNPYLWEVLKAIPNQLKSTNWGTLDYITATNVAAEFCNYTKDLGATKHYVCPPNLNFHTLPGNLSFMGQGMWWCRQTELRSKTVYHEDFNNLFAIHFNDIPDKAQDDNDYLFGEKDVDYIMKLSCPKISQLFDPKRPELSN